MSITASEARNSLFSLIKKVNENHDAIEIVSEYGNAVLVAADDYAALRESTYLLRSPANARRLLNAYKNALREEREINRIVDERMANRSEGIPIEDIMKETRARSE